MGRCFLTTQFTTQSVLIGADLVKRPLLFVLTGLTAAPMVWPIPPKRDRQSIVAHRSFDRLTKSIHDEVIQSYSDLLRQRIYRIASGYPDCNDAMMRMRWLG